ncbi:hypothetical protein [Teredinibacter turnerae]|uniref:hypothetical protein n=1 Tax=Teredinibacter turnerae TaxID=2426 RepID=UPI001F076255|nr:hypothetical protein [Teredinibacter turnerae]
MFEKNMINGNQNPLAWVQLISELEDARDHLGSLIEEMMTNGAIDVESYAVDIAHIYAHLNRAWNTRNIKDELTEDQWENGRSFPTDIEPIA